MKYKYILIEVDGLGQAYQEIDRNGQVVRYTDLDGTFLFQLVPTGLSSQVLDPAPAEPAWALDDPDPEPYVEPPPPARRLTKLSFVGRLGTDFATILTAAKASVEVELFVKMLDWATPDPDGTSVDLDDPRVVYALNTLEAAGLIAEGRAAEILGA